MTQDELPEPRRANAIPWTIGDVARGVGVAVLAVVAIAFIMGIGTVFLVGIEAFTGLGGQDVGGLLDVLAAQGQLDVWLLFMGVAMLAGEGVMPFAAWLFSSLKYRCGWRALGFRSFDVRRGLLSAVLVVLAGLLIGFLYDLLLVSLGVDAPSAVPSEFTASGPAFAMVAVLAVFVAPLAEETFFRGFMFAGIAKRLGYVWGIVLSALLFSLAHMEVLALPPIFILGLLLAWLYVRTGSIWPCIVAHFGYNSIALLFMI